MIKAPDKILGVLGGMGPAATAELLRLITVKSPAAKDQEHPVIYVLCDSQMPDRVDAIDGLCPDPTPRLKKDLEKLIDWGATLLATPCNTAHIFIDTFYKELSVPYIHIVKETIASCRLRNPEGAWLLATTGTCRTGLYQSHAKEMRYTFHTVDDVVQAEVQKCAWLVKANKMEESGAMMRSIVEGLWKKKDMLIATACTELPLAYNASGLPAARNASSLDALADACLEVLYPDLYKRS